MGSAVVTFLSEVPAHVERLGRAKCGKIVLNDGDSRLMERDAEVEMVADKGFRDAEEVSENPGQDQHNSTAHGHSQALKRKTGKKSFWIGVANGGIIDPLSPLGLEVPETRKRGSEEKKRA
jgi:hypothetical protein